MTESVSQTDRQREEMRRKEERRKVGKREREKRKVTICLPLDAAHCVM